MIKLRVLLFAIVTIFANLSNLHPQDEPRAAWQVTNFDITVNNPGSERALTARATVSLRNVGRGPGSSLTLRINSKAEIKAVSSGGSTAGYRLSQEPRGNAQRVT